MRLSLSTVYHFGGTYSIIYAFGSFRMPRFHIRLVPASRSLQNFVTHFRDLSHGAKILATIPGRPRTWYRVRTMKSVVHSCVLLYVTYP